MKPVKVYPKEGEKGRLLKAFTKENSILGSSIDSTGKYYIIVDKDYSKILNQY